jgi:EAL domain-containing protein (putative c-di-GMP-specific phosphodiesterase class I)
LEAPERLNHAGGVPRGERVGERPDFRFIATGGGDGGDILGLHLMDVFAEIRSLIEEFKIEPSRLRIEITETVMMTEAENRMAILNRFRESGFIVEMDDFGSGYSSLNQLKDMPLDVLKIDMKFLSSSKNSQKAEIILRNVLKLSGDLGLSSLTEGVETEAQYHMLNKMGCNLFQGYFFDKPMTVDEFEKVCDSKVA